MAGIYGQKYLIDSTTVFVIRIGKTNSDNGKDGYEKNYQPFMSDIHSKHLFELDKTVAFQASTIEHHRFQSRRKNLIKIPWAIDLVRFDLLCGVPHSGTSFGNNFKKCRDMFLGSIASEAQSGEASDFTFERFKACRQTRRFLSFILGRGACKCFYFLTCFVERQPGKNTLCFL